MTLTLEDLKPVQGEFKLEATGERIHRLKVFSLAARIWAKRRFGEQLGAIFENKNIPEMAELAFYLMEDKSDFPDFMAFAEKIVTIKDQVELSKAMLCTIGIDDKLLKELSSKVDASPNGITPSL